jgi:mono/diheme cytochrome c family protein
MAGACAGHGTVSPFRDASASLVKSVAIVETLPLAAQVSGAPRATSSDLVAKYCVSCHSDRLKTGGLSLQNPELADVPAHAEVWERVARKLRSGEMPPSTVRVRPEASAVDEFVSSLETTLDRAALEHPRPGRAPVHRLNRAEYSNAVRDLLAVDVRPGGWLPVDDSGYGFDNIAAVLSTSPALLDRYMSAARRVSALAIGDPAIKPVEEIYKAKRDPNNSVRNERLSDDLPFDSRAGIVVSHYFPLDADYVFKVRALGVQADGDQAEIDPYQVRIAVKAGLHTVGVTSPRENLKAERDAPTGAAGQAAGGRGGSTQIPTPVDLRLDGARVKRFDVMGTAPEVSTLIVGGPYDSTGPGNTPSRRAIFTCHPSKPADEPACARTILATLARRAFRRPVTKTDVDPLYAFYQQHREGGRGARGAAAPGLDVRGAGAPGLDFDSGIAAALEAILVAPEFLFRIEQDPKAAASNARPFVSDVELASRLSFFLWSSIPDEELLVLAEQKRLSDPAILERQVRRMLDDPRADALVANFVGQWLQLRNVATVQPDPMLLPFDEALRDAFFTETTLFVSSIFREDRSLLDLLTADYTFVNQRLAEHYGIPRIYGSQFRRVTVTDANRRGLLGQGSVLTVTSYPIARRSCSAANGYWRRSSVRHHRRRPPTYRN